MNCSWDKSLENKQLDVQKVTSKGPKPPKWFENYMVAFEKRFRQGLMKEINQELSLEDLSDSDNDPEEVNSSDFDDED